MGIEKVTALWCHCEVCGHEWIARVEPERCAKCKRRTWNRGGVVAGPVKPPEPAVEPKPRGLRKMSAEEFLKLSNSDRLRAQREGKF